MIAGILVWTYTLLLPSLADAAVGGLPLVAHGPFGIGLLRPQGLFGVDLPPLVHGMLWSLSINLAANAISFPLPLTDTSGNSFQKANEGPPTDPKVFEAQQKQLQDDLQKRADELRKKLEAQGQAQAPR